MCSSWCREAPRFAAVYLVTFPHVALHHELDVFHQDAAVLLQTHHVAEDDGVNPSTVVPFNLVVFILKTQTRDGGEVHQLLPPPLHQLYLHLW